LNLNGIRSAATKGFEAWTQSMAADCMGVQEIKAQADTVVGRFEHVGGMNGHFHYADKKGYSGVGLYSRKPPTGVITGIGNPEFDAEGRYVEARFDDDGRAGLEKLSIISCYFPSGSSGEERQQAKYRFLALMAPHLRALAAERELILVGDINIAHKEIDLKNWRGNQKNSGFLPEERAWLTHLLDEIGLVDVFRTLNPHPEQYTWWSNRGQAWAKNVGWRLDYHLATPAVARHAKAEYIHLETRFSDHAPLVIDYDFTL
jgi:exodeoxyribonuclease-3